MSIQPQRPAVEEWLTTDFVVTQEPAADGFSSMVAVWVDWNPAVDGDPSQPLQGRRAGSTLWVGVKDSGSEGLAHPWRRLEGLSPEVQSVLQGPLLWIVCGPSGVLSRRQVVLES